MENLYALIDKILPMLSTILGAYITYYVTVSSKKNEAKVNAQIRARDEYWIPCSIAIENLQNKVSELSKNENALVSFTGEKSCESETIQLLKYLQAVAVHLTSYSEENALPVSAVCRALWQAAVPCFSPHP